MKKPRILTASVGALLFTALSLHAQTWTWSGAAGNNSWNNGGNWSGGVAPPNNGTVTIFFGSSPRLTPDLTLSWNVNGVIFDATAVAYSLFSTAGNTLTIGAGGIINYDNDDQFIQHAITLSAAQTWNVGSSDLYVTGAVNNGGNLLTIDAAQISSGVEIKGVISGSGGLNNSGPGILYLDGTAANTYSGTTTVNSGTLILDKLSGTTAIPGTLLVGDGVGTAVDVLRNYQSDQIADSATVSIFSTGAWTLESNTSEAITNLNIVSTGIVGGGLLKIGTSTVQIQGTLTMTGGTVMSSGAGELFLLGNLTTNAADLTATISSTLHLFYYAHSFDIADGAAPIDMDIAAVMYNLSNGFDTASVIKNGPGALRLGGANVYEGGTTLNAGTLVIGHDSAFGTGPLTVNGGTLRADGARTVANAITGSGFAVDGAFDLTLNSSPNLSGGITKNGTGTLIFPKAGIIAGALTVNTGTVRFDADFSVGNGLTNSGTVLIGAQTLAVNGAGLNNQGSLPLAGGMLAGSGPVVNYAAISGFGTIGGSGGFTNNAQLTVSGGSFTLSKSGANSNAGNVAVPAGLQLRLTGSPLANTGTVDLAGGIVAGTATLSNIAGGTVSGRGLISAPFANAGTLRAIGGTLNVTSAFASSGVIRLDGAAGLAGGAITNTGRIEGDGSIANAIANTGRIEPIGTLVLGGAVTNTGAGLISATPGNSVVFTAGLATNAAVISLAGGTFDNNGFAFNNTGQLSGSGRFWSGGVTNNGTGRIDVAEGGDFQFLSTLVNNSTIDTIGGTLRVEGAATNAASTGFITARNAILRFNGGLSNNGRLGLSFGTSDIFGAITNNAAGRIIVSGNSEATFNNNIVNNGIIQVSTGSAAVYFRLVSGPGSYAGGGTNFYEGGFSPGASPALITIEGSAVFGAFNTTTMEIGGLARGTQYDAMNVGLKLTFDGTLDVPLINAFVPQFGNAFNLFDWGTTAGTFTTVNVPALNPGLAWDQTTLYTDGTLRIGLDTAFVSRTWDGGGANNDWSTNNNWTLDVQPLNNATADLIFAGNVRLSPSVDTAWNVRSITFSNAAGAFTITGPQAVTIGSGGIVNDDTQTQTITAAITLSANENFNAAAGDLSISSIALAVHTLTLTGANDVVLATASGTGIIDKNNSGRFDITGALGTGGVTLNANTGTTNIGASEILAALNIGNGATVTLGGIAPAAAAGQAVPEPGFMFLLTAGLLPFLIQRCR